MARRDPEGTTYGFTVAAAVGAVPAARRQVVAFVQDLGLPLSDQALENVELLASEVIANAVLHSDAPCDVAVKLADDRLRVEVTDVDACLPSVVQSGPDDESGRGLLLVNALADAWGTRPEATGKTTWFEIAPEPPTVGVRNDGADTPPSLRMDDAVVRRTECRTRIRSSAESRLSVGTAGVGERHQAA
ncbi:ATP-binding protein [Streptomyces sp. NPDC047072]|uniref:ATP-binding protein n=1 Tax=Streptomyces sp. NPDC047072 TaxID=3154809 RepID=UPI0033BFE651